jgi:hypothetical protein
MFSSIININGRHKKPLVAPIYDNTLQVVIYNSQMSRTNLIDNLIQIDNNISQLRYRYNLVAIN